MRRDLQEQVRPIAISHGANSPRAGRSRFWTEFDGVGTDDPTAVLSVPEALRFLGSLLPGGWPALRRHNRQLVLKGRRRVCEALGHRVPAPDGMIGSLASVPLPPGTGAPSTSALYDDPLQQRFLERWKLEVPVVPWPAPPARLLRISAQIYNREDDYRVLADALREEL